MNLICPSCGARHSAEAWENDRHARECVMAVAGLPRPVAGLALRYLAFFRPRKRALSWARAGKLLGEVKALLEKERVSWNHAPARPNAVRAWAEAMERMIAHPPRQLPLGNHRYLTSVAYGILDEMDKESERRHVERERSGSGIRRKTGPPVKDLEPITPDEMRAIREKNLGRTKT